MKVFVRPVSSTLRSKATLRPASPSNHPICSPALMSVGVTGCPALEGTGSFGTTLATAPTTPLTW